MPTIFKKSTLFLLFFSAALAATAQISNLKSKAKTLTEKDKENPKTEKPAADNTKQTPSETTQPASSATPAKSERGTDRSTVRIQPSPANDQRGGASSDKTVPPSQVELDFGSQPFPPAIAWSSLLFDGCWYYNITNGELHLNNMDVSFLPKKTKSGEDVNYASYANKIPLLRMDVVDTETGAVKGSLHYSAKADILPFFTMEQLTGSNYAFSVNAKEGKYELRFFAGTQQFYTYPFSI